MTDDILAALLAKPLQKKPWDDAAKWLKANGNPVAAKRLKVWADARKELRTALSWDRPATLAQVQAAADALPDERCRRLFVGLFDWLDERFPWPALSFPTWNAPWTAPRVRLVQTLDALGAMDDSLVAASNNEADNAYGAGMSESECAADDSGDSLERQLLLARGNAVAAAASTLQYPMYVRLREHGHGLTEAEIGGRMTQWAVEGAGHSGEVRVWQRAIADAAAAGRPDPRGGGRGSAAYQWAMANGVPAAVEEAKAEAVAVASAAVYSLAAWEGWGRLAEELAG